MQIGVGGVLCWGALCGQRRGGWELVGRAFGTSPWTCGVWGDGVQTGGGRGIWLGAERALWSDGPCSILLSGAIRHIGLSR